LEGDLHGLLIWGVVCERGTRFLLSSVVRVRMGVFHLFLVPTFRFLGYLPAEQVGMVGTGIALPARRACYRLVWALILKLIVRAT